MYRDDTWRDRARPATLAAWSHRWSKIDVEETGAHQDVVGISLDRLALDRGTTPFDLLLDLALSDTSTTRFRVVLENDNDAEIADLLADRRTLLGLSDAGAHASQLCDACYSTHLLGHWVRERKALTLSDAVWRLTGQPHQAFRVAERGLVREGFHADLVAFDPDTIGTTPSSGCSTSQAARTAWSCGAPASNTCGSTACRTRVAGIDVPGAARPTAAELTSPHRLAEISPSGR